MHHRFRLINVLHRFVRAERSPGQGTENTMKTDSKPNTERDNYIHVKILILMNLLQNSVFIVVIRVLLMFWISF